MSDIPADQMDVVLHVVDAKLTRALAQAGFIRGKYGELAYTIDWDCPVPYVDPPSKEDSTSVLHAQIIVDERTLGHIAFDSYGECKVSVDMARWMNPPAEGAYTIGGRAYVGTFPIRTDVKVKYADLTTRKYSPVDRAKEKLYKAYEKEKAEAMIAMFKKATGGSI